jgi:exonuclease III
MSVPKNLKLLSLNVRAVCATLRRGRVYFSILNFEDMSYDIIMLQETYIASDLLQEACKSQWDGYSFWSKGSVQSKGAAILFRSDLNMRVSQTQKDTEGRLLCVDCSQNGDNYRFINVYCPNGVSERNEFLNSLWSYACTSRIIILAGDFNFIVDCNLDRICNTYLPLDRRYKSYHVSSDRTFDSFRQAARLLMLLDILNLMRKPSLTSIVTIK